MRTPTLALIALAICTSANSADAFLLLGKSKKVGNPATRAVMVREAGRTVVALQPRYVGPADSVALLVPVPKGATGEPSTISPAQLERLDQVSAPRLSEVWEQDPCELHVDQPDALGGPEPGRGASPTASPAPPPDSKWNPQPLDGKTGADVVAAIEKAGYFVPEGAVAVLEAHIASGGGFVLATVDAPKGDGEGVMLPPLRLEYDEKVLTLGTRLAAIRGNHDFTAYVLSSEGRHEAAGQPNQGMPTNLDVVSTIQGKVPTFYGHLADFVFATRPSALVTEYAWSAAACEGCTSPLVEADMQALGIGLLPSAKGGKQHEVLVEAGDVASLPDGPDDLRERLSVCYGKALATRIGVGGEVTLDVATGAAGEVTQAVASGDADAQLRTCAEGALKGGKLDKYGKSGTVKVKFSPLSREYFASYVLTRLHTRFDKAPERDLTLRRGSPLEGGREAGPDDRVAPARAYASDTEDNYQSRYVIRHAWEGKIECQTPKRGVWGGPPDGGAAPSAKPTTPGAASAAPSASPAASAKPKDKKVDTPDKKKTTDKGEDKSVKSATELAEWLADGKVPDLASFAIDLPAPGPVKPPAPKPAPAPAASAPPAPAPEAAPAVPPPADGCGCSMPGATAPPGFAVALVAAAALLLRRVRGRPADR